MDRPLPNSGVGEGLMSRSCPRREGVFLAEASTSVRVRGLFHSSHHLLLRPRPMRAPIHSLWPAVAGNDLQSCHGCVSWPCAIASPMSRSVPAGKGSPGCPGASSDGLVTGARKGLALRVRTEPFRSTDPLSIDSLKVPPPKIDRSVIFNLHLKAELFRRSLGPEST